MAGSRLKDCPPDLADERWKLVRELLASPSFSKAPRLSSFLAYICLQTLRGQGAELSERHIGIEVFGRAQTYNPAEDSIVRASARLLRTRLEQYFVSEGVRSTWIITIPKGSYVPAFLRREEPDFVDIPDDVQLAVLEPQPVAVVANDFARQAPSIGWGIAGILLLLGVLALSGYRLRRPPQTHPVKQRQKLWAELLTQDRRTLFVAGDSTLSLLQTGRKKPLGLSEYLSRAYSEMPSEALLPGGFRRIDEHQYTSSADLNMAFRVTRLPEAQNAQMDVRYARNLTLGDAKSSNLIMMGGIRANPWVELFDDRVDYFVDNDTAKGIDYVLVHAPREGEQSQYSTDMKTPDTYSFGVVAFVTGLSGEGSTLLLEGTSMAGTESVCDFVLDPVAFSNFESKVTRPDGRLNHFEALIGTKIVQGNSSQPQVLAYRVLP